MDRKRLLELAISGVKQELSTLETELAAISRGVAAGTQSLIRGKPARKARKQMSAAARKAISDAKKAWWAKRKKAKK
jgi:hypothetical protein